MTSRDGPQRVCWDGWFCITLPPQWIVDESQEEISVYRPDGVGAITISVFSEYVTPDSASSDLALRFAAQMGVAKSDVLIVSACTGRVEIAFWEFGSQAPRHWRVAAFDRDKQAIVMSYNSSEDDRAKEADAVDTVFQSFEWDRSHEGGITHDLRFRRRGR